MKGKGKIAAALLTACLLSAEAGAHEDYGEQLEGIVIDATMNSVSVVTAQGELLTFPVPEEISLADGLMLGTPVSVRLENGRATRLSDGAEKPRAQREALAFAGSVRFMAENRSLQGLSSLAAFPLTVRENGGVRMIAAPAELETLDPSLIFPDARREAVLSANLYELREENGRWTLGPEGGPNIVFQRDETGTGFRVTEVN